MGKVGSKIKNTSFIVTEAKNKWDRVIFRGTLLISKVPNYEYRK